MGPKPLLTHELQTIIPKLVLHWSIHRIHLFQNLSNDSSFFLLSTLFHYHFTRRRTEKASLSTSNLRADSDGSESPIEKKAKIICLMEKNPRHLDNYPYDSIWLRGGERKKKHLPEFPVTRNLATSKGATNVAKPNANGAAGSSAGAKMDFKVPPKRRRIPINKTEGCRAMVYTP